MDGVAFVEIAFLVKLFKQIPEGLDVLVVVGDVGVVEVHPIAHLFGEGGPLLGVFQHLLTALPEHSRSFVECSG